MPEPDAAERSLGEVRAHVHAALRSLAQLAVHRGELVLSRAGKVVELPVSQQEAARVAQCGLTSIRRAVASGDLVLVPVVRNVDGIEHGIEIPALLRWMQNRRKAGRPRKNEPKGNGREARASS